jgi:hypothetical protein
MTIGTYAHVIRELKGEPVVSAEEQIKRARSEHGASRSSASRPASPCRDCESRTKLGRAEFAPQTSG